MVQQADSIQTDAALEAESQQQVLRQHSSQLTPKEVLSWLPKNATPAQQDSMIGAHIKPSEIHWSRCRIHYTCQDIRQVRVLGM